MSEWLYPGFLLLTLLELAYEVSLSRRNSEALLARGARECSPGTLPLMTALYAAMYAGGAFEYFALRSGTDLRWFGAMLLVYGAAKALKFWAIRSLGSNWTMKVLIVPGSQAVTAGPYRWIRHPNYVAVLMEIAATTLAGRSYWTCALVLTMFVGVLWSRIRSEERALAGLTDYAGSMGPKRRFLP